jgi:hypothetical protein
MAWNRVLPAALWMAIGCTTAEGPVNPPPSTNNCLTRPLIVATPATASWPANTATQATFTATNSCTAVLESRTLFVSRTGSVSSAGTPVPTTLPALNPGQSTTITIPYTVGAPGAGTLELSETTGGPSPSTTSAILAVTVTAPGTGIPFGMWGLKLDPLTPGGPWSGGVKASNDHLDMMNQLRWAEPMHLRLWFFVPGGVSGYQTNGAFDLEKWKQRLDYGKEDGSTSGHYGKDCTTAVSCYYEDLLPFIQSGTLQGFVLIDDLSGEFSPPVSFEEVEVMAAYSRMRFPGLLTAVRERATVLEEKTLVQGGVPRYSQLDVAWSQYRSIDRGPAPTFRDLEIAAARRMGLGLVLGINIAEGGIPRGTPVRPDSLLKWGNDLLAPGASDYVCGFFMARVDSNLVKYDMSPLSVLAASHVIAPCRRRP